jgi:excinuclease ABC subunit A
MAEEFGFSLDTPYQDYPQKIKDLIMYGTDKKVSVHYKGQRGEGVYPVAFEGLVKNVQNRYKETYSESSKQEYESL